jgi:hypothetical protein
LSCENEHSDDDLASLPVQEKSFSLRPHFFRELYRSLSLPFNGMTCCLLFRPDLRYVALCSKHQFTGATLFLRKMKNRVAHFG